MLAAGTVLRLPSGSASSIVASTSTTTTSQLCGTQLPVIGAWSLPTPSTVSDVRRAGAVQPDSREMKPIAVTPGEYLVSHVINGKPLLPLTSSTVDHLVGQPLAQVSSTVANGVGPRPHPVLAGFGVQPSVAGTDAEVLVPQRRDVVVLLATGPTPATAVPRHPGTVSQATEPSYVYYTTIPRFCAVTTSSGSAPTVFLPASSGTLAGGLVNTVWAPGAVVRGQIAPGSETFAAAGSQDSGKSRELIGNAAAVVLSTSPNCSALWTPTAVIEGPATPGSVTSGAGFSHYDLTKSCSGPVESGDGGSTLGGKSESITTVASSDPAPNSSSPAAHDANGTDGAEGGAPSTTSRTFTCSECSRDFSSEKYLNMHRSLHFQSAALAPNRRAIDATASPSLHGGTPEVLASTPMMLTSQQQLITAPPPIRRTKTTTVGVGGTSCTSQWTCQICEKTFAQNSNYKNHIRTHSNERPFVCEICAIGFKERYHLKKHVLFKHTDELREECRVCGKRFKDSTAVRAHERTHSDARPYACPRCEKTFKTSECLWHHENRSKTCGKSLGELPTSRQCGPTRARRGRQPRRAGRSPSHLHLPSAVVPHHVFRHEAKVDVDAVIAREMSRHLQHPPLHHSQQQRSIYISSISPSAQFAELVPDGSPDQPESILAQSSENPHHQYHNQEHSVYSSSGCLSAQFAEQAPTGAHHTASPDQPESGSSGFVNFDCGSMDWDLSRSDSAHPVVKVEAAEMMDLLDYNLAAFNPPSDSLSSYPDIFDKVKVDIGESAEEIDDYDDLDDDDDDVAMEFKQQLLMQEINKHSMTSEHVCQLQSDKMDCQAGQNRCPLATPDGGFDDELGDRPYRCHVCHVGFKLKVHLKKHNLYKHSDDYPCQCGVCGKRFKDSSAVRLHERIHSSARPYSCQRCGKSFKTRENLWGHRHRGPCERFDLATSAVVSLDCLPPSPTSTMNGSTTFSYDDHRQKGDAVGVDSLDVVQVDFSTHGGNVWPSVCAAMEEVRSSTSMNLIQPCRSRVPASLSAAFGAQVPMAVVAPIKRELPDQASLVAEETTLAAGVTTVGAEKYSLPPFETLVTSHRSPEMTAASPSSTTNKRPTPSTTVAVGVPSSVSVGVPSSTVSVGGVAVRLPGIHQLFQTTSGQPVTGTGNSLSAVNDEAVRYTWSQNQLLSPGTGAVQSSLPLFQQEQQLIQFFTKTEEDPTPTHSLPPPPPYPGLPGPGSGRPYLTYGGVRNPVVEYTGFHSVLSSARR